MTISDFLRKRRIDLGLRQRDVAVILNVTIASIRNWEGNSRRPRIEELPRLVEFIGYCPYDVSLPMHKKIVLWRSYNGITQTEMANMMGIDPSTLARLEQGTTRSKLYWQKHVADMRSILNAIWNSELSDRVLKNIN